MKPILTKVAIIVCIFAFLYVLARFLVPYLEGPPEYRTIAQGPTSREQMVVSSNALPVTTPAFHEIQMTAKTRSATSPTDPLVLHYELLAPNGELVQQGDEGAKPTGGLRWSPAFVLFEAKTTGDYTLRLTLPQPVSYVDLVLRERRN